MQVSEHTVGSPASTRGKQKVHFSALLVCQLKYTFLYGQLETQNRHDRHAFWSTRTIPSSSRLYIAPDGQLETQGGLMQCSQILGRYIINTCSNSIRTDSSIPAILGSR
ncbi:hypothetical protein D3C81_1821040 [compost metagenome]